MATSQNFIKKTNENGSTDHSDRYCHYVLFIQFCNHSFKDFINLTGAFWKEKDAYLESTRKKRCLILNSKGEYIRCPKYNKCEVCERSEKDQYLSRYISLDKFMDDNSDDDTNRSGWEPTDNTSTENSVLSLMMIDDLINEVSLKYPEAKAIFSLLMDDPQISNALKQVDLKKGKSQAYEYVKKMQAYAKELYNKNYR